MDHAQASGGLAGLAGQGALLLGNPICLERHGLDLAGLAGVFARLGLPVEAIALPESYDPAEWLAQLRAGRHSMLIAAGGDGTINQVINLAAPLGLPLGVLPMGTANDFARGMHLPTELEAAARVIVEQPALGVDVATVNGHYFVNAAHLGWGVETAKRTNATLKGMVGPLAYLLAATQAYFEAEPIGLELTIDGQTRSLEASQLLVGNGRYFGGGNVVAREASLEDGLLDVYVLEAGIGPADALKIAAALRTGALEDQAGVMHARTVRLEARLNRPSEINVDGELLALGDRLHFEVLPAGLSVYGRSTAALENPLMVPNLL